MNKSGVQLSIITGFFLVCSLFIACNGGSATKTTAELKLEKETYNYSLLADAKKIIRTGDLILRGGKDFSSRFVKGMNKKDTTYSHGGIAVYKDSLIYIYHIVPDHYNINDKVKFEAIDSFCTQFDNTDFAVARFNLDSAQIKTLIEYLQQQYEKKIPFDMDFNLTSDDKLYCSEMISKGLKLATHNRLLIKVDTLNDRKKYKLLKMYYNMPESKFANRIIIPIDHLFLDSNCAVIKRYTYE